METKNWDDLEQLARSQNPHERVSAVVKARARAGGITTDGANWGIDGTSWEGDLKKAGNIRTRIAHYEYDPTVEEAITTVRAFFEGWRERVEERLYDEMLENQQAMVRREMDAIVGKLISIYEEILMVVNDLYELYPGKVEDPSISLPKSFNDICELCNIPHIVVLASNPNAILKEGSDEAFFLALRIVNHVYVPMKTEEVVRALEKLQQLLKFFNDFAKQHRAAKPRTAVTAVMHSKVSATVIKRPRRSVNSSDLNV